MKADLACCKQHGMTEEAYYGKLNKIWDNVNNYIPHSTCVENACAIWELNKKKTEKMSCMVLQFCLGL